MAGAPLTLRGTYTALITPFTADGEKVDWAALKQLVERQIDAGVEGLVPCGTTGEGPSLGLNERKAVIDTVLKNRGKLRVVAGTGCVALPETIDRMTPDGRLPTRQEFATRPTDKLFGAG